MTLTHREQVLVGNIMQRATIRDLAQQVCKMKRHDMRAVMGPSQRAEDCRVRDLICYLAREQGFSYPQIGRVLGRHHTTIIHAVANERKRRAEQGFAEDQTMPYNEQRRG